MTQTQFWLIRHGQTDWNVAKRWQGHEPTHLNAQGHSEASQLATYLKDQPFDAIYTSDLPRAYETATPLAEQHGLPLIHDKRLREIDVGIFQGLNKQNIKERYADEYTRWDNSDDHYAAPNGESRNQLKERAAQAIADFSKRGHSQVAVVTHGGTIRLLLQHLLSQREDFKGRISVPNTSFTVVETQPDRSWKLLRLTETPHIVPADNKTDGHGL